MGSGRETPHLCDGRERASSSRAVRGYLGATAVDPKITALALSCYWRGDLQARSLDWGGHPVLVQPTGLPNRLQPGLAPGQLSRSTKLLGHGREAVCVSNPEQPLGQGDREVS